MKRFLIKTKDLFIYLLTEVIKKNTKSISKYYIILNVESFGKVPI